MKNLKQYIENLYLPGAEQYNKLLTGTYNEKIAEIKKLYRNGMFTDGEGNVFAGALVFVVEVKTTTEVRKLMELKKHVEPMLSISLDMPVNIWVKSHL
nr:hypothetical protein [uncultured Blautia sp.]